MPDVANDYKKSEVSINTQFKKKKERKTKRQKRILWHNGSGLKGFVDHEELQVP